MVDVSELVVLQEVDLRLDEYKKDLSQLDELLGDPPWRPALETELEVQADLLQTGTRTRQAAEVAADGTREKIKGEETKLYSGSITDARELQALQEEIFALRRQLKGEEEALLEAMAPEEQAQAATAYVTQLLEGSVAAWETRRAELQSRHDAVSTAAAAVQAEVDDQRALIEAEELAVYDEHRTRWPVVIAKSVSGVCGSCRLALPTTVLTRARRGTEVIYCPACGCIVYLR